jgi:cytochrome o ubiquinol oxidase subunit I
MSSSSASCAPSTTTRRAIPPDAEEHVHPPPRLRANDLRDAALLGNDHYPTRQNIVNGAIATTAAAIVLGGVAATALLITRYRKWRLVWRDWLTSVDHKRIGIMYVVIALVMLARGLIEANIMRAQMAFGLGGGFLPADHFEQFFTTHGTIMIFCVAMPFLTGLINLVMPLQIGARDVAFPIAFPAD